MIELVGKVEKVDRCILVTNGITYTEVVVSVLRHSGVADNIILVYQDERFKVTEGTYVKAIGDVRTYKETNGPLKTRVKVAVKAIEEVDYNNLSEDDKTLNHVEDDVFVIKSSKMRRTPNKLRITDLKVGKRNSKGKLYTYAAIAWGINAKLLSGCEPDTQIYIEGRLQEREYTKRDDNGERVLNTYEVSINKVEM